MNSNDDVVVVISNDYLEQSLTAEVNRTQELRTIINEELLQLNSILDDYDTETATTVAVINKADSSHLVDSKLFIDISGGNAHVIESADIGKVDDALTTDDFNDSRRFFYNEINSVARATSAAMRSPVRNKHEQHKPLNQKSMNVIAFPLSHYSNYTQYSSINKLTTDSGTNNNTTTTKNTTITTATTTSDKKLSYMSHFDLIQVHHN
jgi:hypothetical protein